MNTLGLKMQILNIRTREKYSVAYDEIHRVVNEFKNNIMLFVRKEDIAMLGKTDINKLNITDVNNCKPKAVVEEKIITKIIYGMDDLMIVLSMIYNHNCKQGNIDNYDIFLLQM